MTRITEKPFRRVTPEALPAIFGKDKDKSLVVELRFIDGKSFLGLRPLGARNRTELISCFDVFTYALKCRANRELLEKARTAKERKAVRLATQRQARAEKRLFKK